jgi:hypothetical protein
MAQYFFNFRPGLTNLYVKLAEKIKAAKWGGSIITLNYERLLEMSFGHIGLKLICNQKSINNQIEICFPHGCCHLFCDSVFATANGVTFSGASVQTNGQVSPIAEPNLFFQRITANGFPPVMCYFNPEKEITSGANFILAQKSRMKDLIAEAKRILIIGVRIREHDKHIWGYLQETNAQIIYCAPSASDFHIWQNKHNRPKDIALESTFTDFFEEICNYLKI